MPIEKPPMGRGHPLPAGYTPPHSIPYRVKDDDTWETVAAQYHLAPKDLIKHNFHTTNPDEVNWYLRRVTGCWIPSPSGNNWTFRGAKPGVIYIPIKVRTMDEEVITGSPGVGDDPDDMEELFSTHGIHLLHKILDGVEWAGAAVEMFEIGGGVVVEGATAFAAPLAGAIASYIALGLGHLDAINGIKLQQALWGLSFGIVLGADDRRVTFLRMHQFTTHAVSTQYPEQDKNFQLAYTQGLAAGLVYGRRMNSKQRGALRKQLRSHMDMSVYPGYEDYWSDAALDAYYREAAAAFKRWMLAM